MPLSLFQKQQNRVNSLLHKCDTDRRYGVTIVARYTNISDTANHDYSLNYFIKGKKKNGYGLLPELFNKLSADKRFRVIHGGPNMSVQQYYSPNQE